MAYFSDNPKFEDHKNKVKELIFRVQITAHATAASKIHAGDLEGDVALLRSEGITTDADALETITWTTAVDVTNAVFGVILDGSKINEGSAGIEAVYSCEVEERTVVGTAIAVTAPNAAATSAMLTSGGNIALEITGTGMDLNSENADVIVRVRYKLK